jgi:putative peptidase
MTKISPFLLSSLLAVGPLFSSCRDAEDHPLPEGPSRTVLVYQAAQNSLGTLQMHVQDSLEMVKGMRYMKPGERLLLFIDDNRPPRLYELAHGYTSPKLIKRWATDLNSADPATLTEVLQMMREGFPAEDYGLVLWSHATGWLPSAKSGAASSPSTASQRPLSFGVDVGPDGNMYRDMAAQGGRPDEIETPRLAEAIQQSGVHLNYILFDCCLMQCIEAAYDLRHAADYLVASPIAISAAGGDYTKLVRDGLFASDIRRLGQTYVAHYQELLDKKTDDFGVVLSILRTDRLQALADALSATLPAPTLTASGTTNYWDLTGTQHYAPYVSNFFYRPEYFDMNDVLRRHLSPTDYAEVKTALDAAIVYKGATPRFFSGPLVDNYIDVDAEHYCGVSMFVPQAHYTAFARYCPQGDLNIAFRHTAWYQAAGWSKQGW